MELINNKEYLGTPVNAEYGPNPKSGKAEARLLMEIVEGDCKGLQVPYKANMKDTKSISYAKRDMVAAGWKGKTIGTFAADIAAANKAGIRVAFKARLASFTRDDGSKSEWWTVGSIGVSEVPLGAPTADMTKDVDAWFDAAGGNDDDLPF